MPPSQRNNYDCEKESTGPLNRKKLIEHINKEALETPDRPEFEPFIKGKIRGKKWLAPPPDAAQLDADEKIAIDLGDEYEQALTDASQEEIIDLAGKLLLLLLLSLFSLSMWIDHYSFFLQVFFFFIILNLIDVAALNICKAKLVQTKVGSLLVGS